MKLVEVHVREFKSVWDSGPLRLDRATTCLVGKNEAGKTALLEAIYRLNPIVEGDGIFDVTEDYPRSVVEDYTQEVESGRRPSATVITATFQLEAPELKAITMDLGPGALSKPFVVLRKGYTRSQDGSCELQVEVPLAEGAIAEFLVEIFQVPESLGKVAAKMTKLSQLAAYLKDTAKRQELELKTATEAAETLTDPADKAAAREYAETEQSKALRARVAELVAIKDLGRHVWETYLEPHLPKFLYFDKYYRWRVATTSRR